MQTISKEYTLLFNAMTDAEETLAHLRQTLIDAQRQAEENGWILVQDTDNGRILQGQIEDLKQLLEAYQTGLIKEG